MNKNKAWEDLLAFVSNLEDSIKLYRDGKKDAYRIVAAQLRALLCDSNSVVLRIFPKAALHPLNGLATRLAANKSSLLNGLVFSPPGTLVMDGKGGAKIKKLFYIKGKPLLLKDWLAQPLINSTITIENFIKSISDKEGKHSDINYGNTLNLVRNVSIANIKFHPELIITIAEYVTQVLKEITSSFSKEEIDLWLKK